MSRFSPEEASEIMQRAHDTLARDPLGMQAPADETDEPVVRPDRPYAPPPEPEPEPPSRRLDTDLGAEIARAVAAMRAEFEAKLAQRDQMLADVLTATNTAMEQIAEVGEDRERAFTKLRDQLHDLRIDLAHLRGDHSELKLMLANDRGKVLDLPATASRVN